MEDLLIEQSAAVVALERLSQSFKKRRSEDVTLAVVEGRRSHLQGLWEKCVSLDTKIAVAAKDSDKSLIEYFSNDIFLKAEKSYFEALDKFNDLIAELRCYVGTRAAGSGETRDSLELAIESTRFVKLPRIDLPKFSGDYLEWQNFRDLFQSLIVSNQDLHNAQKLHYLKSSLTDEAAQLIKHFGITGTNFSNAWEILNKRYENPRVIINSYLNTLLSIPPVKNDSVQGLKILRDTTSEVVHALKSLGHDVADDLLVVIIVKKLDRMSLVEWEKYLDDKSEFPTYKELDTYLGIRIRTLEAIKTATDTHDYKNSETKYSSGRIMDRNKMRNNSVKMLNINASKIQCSLCNNQHLLYRCDKFNLMGVSARLELVKKRRFCYNCLRPGHGVRECRVKRDCLQCGRRHHTLLHWERDLNIKQKRGDVDVKSSKDAGEEPITQD